jgi:D-psicose/D-tagatose/L-ribulose 3-epimerase
MSFEYVVNCDTLGFLGHDVVESPQEVLKAIKDAGYAGVDLPGNPERFDAESLRWIVEDLGLVVPEVTGAWAWAYYGPGGDRNLAGPDKEAIVRGVEHSKRLIDLAVALGATLFPACPTQAPVYELPWPKVPSPILRDNFLGSLRELCQYAADRGVTVVIEPLNRYEAWAGVATTVEETLSLIEDLGVDNLGVQPDVFHMNVAESSVCGALRMAGKHIVHMHINETNHAGLGTGHADFHAIIKALKDIGFAGYVSVYMPFTTQEAWQRTQKLDLPAYLERPLRYLREIEAAVDLQRATYDAGAPYYGGT